MLLLLAAGLASLPCPQSISLVFIVPSKGKQCKEESKTSLVGLRCYRLIGIWGVSCWLQRCGLKPLCWSQGEPALVLLPGVMTDCAALVTTASQEGCAWREWAEQGRKSRCLCLHLTQWDWWPWKQSLVSSGVLRTKLRNTKTTVQALWVGKNSVQISFSRFVERI